MNSSIEDSKYYGKKFHYSSLRATQALSDILNIFKTFGPLILYYIGKRNNNDGTYDIKAYFEYDKRIHLFTNSCYNLQGEYCKCTRKADVVSFIKKLDEFVSNEEFYNISAKNTKFKKKQSQSKLKQTTKHASGTKDMSEILFGKTLLECHNEGLIGIKEMFKIQQAYLEQINKESQIQYE